VQTSTKQCRPHCLWAASNEPQRHTPRPILRAPCGECNFLLASQPHARPFQLLFSSLSLSLGPRRLLLCLPASRESSARRLQWQRRALLFRWRNNFNLISRDFSPSFSSASSSAAQPPLLASCPRKNSPNTSDDQRDKIAPNNWPQNSSPSKSGRREDAFLKGGRPLAKERQPERRPTERERERQHKRGSGRVPDCLSRAQLPCQLINLRPQFYPFSLFPGPKYYFSHFRRATIWPPVGSGEAVCKSDCIGATCSSQFAVSTVCSLRPSCRLAKTAVGSNAIGERKCARGRRVRRGSSGGLAHARWGRTQSLRRA